MIIFRALPYLLFIFLIVAMLLAFKEIFFGKKTSRTSSKKAMHRTDRSDGSNSKEEKRTSQFDDMLKSGMIDKKEYDELKRRYG